MFPRIGIVGLTCLTFAGAAVFALGQPAAKEKSAPVNPAFEKLKSLAGDWINADAKGADAGKVAVNYRLIAGGSALLETMVTEDEGGMVTVYHMDGEHFMMTHYCGLGNQPRMRAEPMTGDKLRFHCFGGTNMKSEKDKHMHSLTVTFTDHDHFNADWTLSDDGKPGETHAFHYARKK